MRNISLRSGTVSNLQSSPISTEVRYPFGVQNDFGQVVIPTRLKDESLNSNPRSPSSKTIPHVGPFASYPSSHSSSSLQSLESSVGLAENIGVELETAIRTNDTARVKRFLNLHHDKFQVSSIIIIFPSAFSFNILFASNF
nr:PREDICTED: uncharacterized protein LOC109033406 [Bemisia tabaci]